MKCIVLWDNYDHLDVFEWNRENVFHLLDILIHLYPDEPKLEEIYNNFDDFSLDELEYFCEEYNGRSFGNRTNILELKENIDMNKTIDMKG